MSENKSGLSTGLVRAGFSGATEQKPVIVIGAGIAGSTAARTLQKRNSGPVAGKNQSHRWPNQTESKRM